MKDPSPELQQAFEILGMKYEADLMEIFHEDLWAGNAQFKPANWAFDK